MEPFNPAQFWATNRATIAARLPYTIAGVTYGPRWPERMDWALQQNLEGTLYRCYVLQPLVRWRDLLASDIT